MKKHIRKPDWLKIRLPEGKQYRNIKEIVKHNKLHTICSSGKCPNIGECWGAGTATFMIAGDICTRSCKFCATKSGRPLPLDPLEPQKIAKSVQLMKLSHCVITSVDRDDLDDGGADHWVKTVKEIKTTTPQISVEILIPDFDGRDDLISIVINSGADVIAHNIETVRRLNSEARSRAQYNTSLKVIKRLSDSSVKSKSGLMVGLGETKDEIFETIADLAKMRCQILTIGQYLQPTSKHLPVAKYVHPDEFLQYKQYALEQGIEIVESAPLVRSSYHAEKLMKNPKSTL